MFQKKEKAWTIHFTEQSPSGCLTQPHFFRRDYGIDDPWRTARKARSSQRTEEAHHGAGPAAPPLLGHFRLPYPSV